jgi:hypothetical protein
MSCLIIFLVLLLLDTSILQGRVNSFAPSLTFGRFSKDLSFTLFDKPLEENSFGDGINELQSDIEDLFRLSERNNQDVWELNRTLQVDVMVPQQKTASGRMVVVKALETMSLGLVLGLGSTALCNILGKLLIEWEWLQAWRYFWPMIGALFLADVLLPDFQGKNSPISFQLLPFHVPKILPFRLLTVTGAAFTLIGGAYDAFMPVWQTGPNVFTVAGIGQDGAVILLLVSIGCILENNWGKQDSSPANAHLEQTTMLLQILLLAELYKLGESSIDDILTSLDGVRNTM